MLELSRSWKHRDSSTDSGVPSQVFSGFFLFLMETKQRFEFMNGMKKSLGYDQMITVESEGLSGGLAVL